MKWGENADLMWILGMENEMALGCWDWWDGLMGGTREMNPESELLESESLRFVRIGNQEVFPEPDPVNVPASQIDPEALAH